VFITLITSVLPRRHSDHHRPVQMGKWWRMENWICHVSTGVVFPKESTW